MAILLILAGARRLSLAGAINLGIQGDGSPATRSRSVQMAIDCSRSVQQEASRHELRDAHVARERSQFRKIETCGIRARWSLERWPIPRVRARRVSAAGRGTPQPAQGIMGTYADCSMTAFRCSIGHAELQLRVGSASSRPSDAAVRFRIFRDRRSARANDRSGPGQLSPRHGRRSSSEVDRSFEQKIMTDSIGSLWRALHSDPRPSSNLPDPEPKSGHWG